MWADSKDNFYSKQTLGDHLPEFEFILIYWTEVNLLSASCIGFLIRNMTLIICVLEDWYEI